MMNHTLAVVVVIICAEKNLKEECKRAWSKQF